MEISAEQIDALPEARQTQSVGGTVAAEDLVRVDGRTVTATTFAEFVAALHSRPELPEAVDFRKAVVEDAKASA